MGPIDPIKVRCWSAMLAHKLLNHLASLRHSVGILQGLADPAPALSQCLDAVPRQVTQPTRLGDDTPGFASRSEQNEVEVVIQIA
ncbi:hypothetical protein C3E98_037790 [Pseudomonas sp. MWU13-2625]|nr:hypothetical protein C3E98_037790 [Pseudomonas sp. MWU13-2625]